MSMPTLSAKESEILRLLIANGEMYGLEMVKASDALKRGTVYVTLGRMEDKGLVTSRAVENPDGVGPQRRTYNVTGLGERVVRAIEAAQRVMRGGAAVASC